MLRTSWVYPRHLMGEFFLTLNRAAVYFLNSLLQPVMLRYIILNNPILLQVP